MNTQNPSHSLKYQYLPLSKCNAKLITFATKTTKLNHNQVKLIKEKFYYKHSGRRKVALLKEIRISIGNFLAVHTYFKNNKM